MMGRSIVVPNCPQRIVSLVPSQSELLFYLGLDAEVVGITKFCIHPKEWHQSKTKVGGTKKLHLKKIISLQPDLIIANKEENTQAEIEYLAQFFPVWISDINTIDDGNRMILMIGDLVGKVALASALVKDIQQGFYLLSKLKNSGSTAYFIWRKPWMVVAKETFIHDVLTKLGFRNVFENQIRYPEINIDELKALNPNYIFLSSEPYPFKQSHIEELQSELPFSKILLVDGEMFSWYGSRMKIAIPYFIKLFQNEFQ